MDLLSLCLEATNSTIPALSPNSPLAEHLICPEREGSVLEIKTYPPLLDHPIAATIWHFDGAGTLHAGVYPFPISFVYHYPFSDGSKTQLHVHDYIELGFIAQGELKQIIMGRECVFHRGDFFLIDMNCAHQDCLIDQEATVIFFGIAKEQFYELLDENITHQNIIAFLRSALKKQKDLQQYLQFIPREGADEKMQPLLASLVFELVSGGVGTAYLQRGLLLRIFHLLGTEYELSLSRAQKKLMQNLLFDDVTNYIDTHLSTVSLEELSRVFHFQADYFNRLFRQKTGSTYLSYVQHQRLLRAEHLLLYTDRSIEEIAREVGYENRSFFYRLFKSVYGLTPSAFREKRR